MPFGKGLEPVRQHMIRPFIQKRLPHETPITGLFMAGDYAGPARGVGAGLACQSGLYCADLVANHLALGIMNW